MTAVSRNLNAAFAAGNAEAAARLFSAGAVFEDLTLRTTIQGRAAIGRYLGRALRELPYGTGASVRHVVGGEQGGGYEWKADGHTVPRGVVALELGKAGEITRLTTTWDGGLMDEGVLSSPAALSFDR
ncbi:hypothetical protein E1286_00780 [Nonomuraea terrae]|uniref:SnoaL-like domain-containing protein n=1 Tax=Nonomuraea terrae TaxID=2530383 RepID=A0A4R4ZHU9_9ACTN|nr:hypothetical protein E1286_00780 [Nonomuraea terrae]